eukprot:3435933-Rhodomonas_salina.3
MRGAEGAEQKRCRAGALPRPSSKAGRGLAEAEQEVGARRKGKREGEKRSGRGGRGVEQSATWSEG